MKFKFFSSFANKKSCACNNSLLVLISSLAFIIVFIPTCKADDSILYAEDTLENEYGKIIYSVTVFRHGDCSETITFPNDPIPSSVWSVGLEALTKEGKQSIFSLGKWLKKRYAVLIGEKPYAFNNITMTSSDRKWAIMSAEVALASMFPPSQAEKWTSENDGNLNWQPVPLHTLPLSLDNKIAFTASCPKLDREMIKLNELPKFRKIYYQYRELFEEVNNCTGMSLGINLNETTRALDDLFVIYSSLRTEASHNLKIIDCANKFYPEPIATIVNTDTVFINMYTFEQKRLHAGPLIGDILSEMKTKLNGTSGQTIHLYAGHDYTIVTLLILFQIYNFQYVPLNSTLLIELRNKTDNFYVTISYRNSTTEPPYLLKIPACGDPCTAEKFINIYRAFVPTDWNAECATALSKNSNSSSIFRYIFYSVQVVIILALASAAYFITKRLYQQKRWRNKNNYEEFE